MGDCLEIFPWVASRLALSIERANRTVPDFFRRIKMSSVSLPPRPPHHEYSTPQPYHQESFWMPARPKTPRPPHNYRCVLNIKRRVKRRLTPAGPPCMHPHRAYLQRLPECENPHLPGSFHWPLPRMRGHQGGVGDGGGRVPGADSREASELDVVERLEVALQRLEHAERSVHVTLVHLPCGCTRARQSSTLSQEPHST